MGQCEIRNGAPGLRGPSALRLGRGGRSCVLRRVGAGASALAIALGVGASPVLAGTSTSAVSPRLRAQARGLYAAVRTYERSTTPSERARSRSAARRVGKVIDACQAPYQKQLFQGFVVGNNSRFKLYSLYENGTLLETYQADVNPVATQLATLAASWAALSLDNRAMNEFVHGLAAEFRATLDAAPFDSCGFVKAIAAHHFSYAWAEQSSYGVQAARWWKQISRAAKASPFWSHFCLACSGRPPSSEPGAHLFTKKQLVVLSNLPGELS